MERKRVLFVCGVFYPEPVVSARLQTDLAMKLSQNYQVTVLRPHPTRPKGFAFGNYDYASFPFQVIEFDSYTCPVSSPIGRMRESISHGLWCAKYIRRHHEEIDFVYNDSWHLFGVSLVAKALCQYKIPYVTPVQDVYPESLASKLPDFKWLKWMIMQVLSPLDHFALSHAVWVQTNSEKMAVYLSDTRQIDRKKFVVVRNWQDEKPFINYTQHQVLKSEDRLFTFMYVGNVGPLAGIEILFEAFAQAALKDARLVIAGSGPAKENLQRKAKRYACTIEFWDVPAGMVPETQAKADVLLLPVKKGFARYSVPSKLAAYLFSAKPVIASVDKDSDTAECIEKSGAGWVVEPDDAQQIASVMGKAFEQSYHVLEEMGSKGLAYSIGNFSKEKNLMMLAEACERAINSR